MTRAQKQRVDTAAEYALGLLGLILVVWYVLKSMSSGATPAVSSQPLPVTTAQYGYGYYWPGQYGAADTGVVGGTAVTAPGLGLNAGFPPAPITIETSPVQASVPPIIPSWTFTGVAPSTGGQPPECGCEAQGV